MPSLFSGLGRPVRGREAGEGWRRLGKVGRHWWAAQLSCGKCKSLQTTFCICPIINKSWQIRWRSSSVGTVRMTGLNSVFPVCHSLLNSQLSKPRSQTGARMDTWKLLGSLRNLLRRQRASWFWGLIFSAWCVLFYPASFITSVCLGGFLRVEPASIVASCVFVEGIPRLEIVTWLILSYGLWSKTDTVPKAAKPLLCRLWACAYAF